MPSCLHGVVTGVWFQSDKLYYRVLVQLHTGTVAALKIEMQVWQKLNAINGYAHNTILSCFILIFNVKFEFPKMA
jgi:hypothetical protein